MQRRLLAALAIVATAGTARGDLTCTCEPDVPDDVCCTRTQGYWKNHYEGAGNPNNPNNSRNIPWPTPCDIDETTIIFQGSNDTRTALQVLDTPDGGLPCIKLAHQAIAAELNVCAGACAPDEVTAAIELAFTDYILQPFCPDYFDSNNVTHQTMVTLADLLDLYNNGFGVGPGHCGGNNRTDECPPDDHCIGGCTRTQGYWKTHSAYGRGGKNKKTPWASLDDVVCVQPNATKFEDYILYAPVTWYDVLAAPSAGGDACIIAGRQYVAARLNIDCLGACTKEGAGIEAALAELEAIFAAWCAAPATGLRPGSAYPNDDDATATARAAARRAALLDSELLDAFNNGGDDGPGHCDVIAENVPATLVSGGGGAASISSLFNIIDDTPVSQSGEGEAEAEGEGEGEGKDGHHKHGHHRHRRHNAAAAPAGGTPLGAAALAAIVGARAVA